MRRGILAAVAALVTTASAAAATPASTAPLAPPPTTVWVAERVSRSAPKVALNAYFEWDRRGGRVTYVAVSMQRGRPRPLDGMTFDSMLTDGPGVYDSGASYGCPAGSGCDVFSGPGVTSFDLQYPATSTQPDRIYLAVAGLSIRVSLVDSPGWRLRATALRARHASSDGGGASGAQFFGEHVERFGNASLAGGSRGSLAVATPPCRPLHRLGYYREGYGTATLTGGTSPVTFDCQKNVADLAAAADRATTWTFAGDVVGTARGTTRLVVIDL